ncbi:hypothetical protein EWM64_g5573 [Hericium alpestre]|uniref:Reverse transcriptase domain-containing protein n=1 Tax=Hericium alpestre TaxID=135208 RepID=A0A4Y9ZY65_9AGAM|nr:hypothetical protein EWM64_g5573 [Hericium alpestre]
MLNRRIAIAALQETHLTEPRLASLDRLFSKRLLVLSSPDPDSPGTCAGVAFAINKDLLDVSNYRFVELIPGRAIALTIHWYDSDAITLLNVYAPNEATRHAAFWRDLRIAWHHNHLPRPDFMMGDFNLVEDGLDRAPAHPDVKSATNALMAFRTHFHLQDTWRHTHPDECCYTHRSHHQNVFALSCLDRIYTSQRHAENVFEWEHDPVSHYSDHTLVCIRFAPRDAPIIGKGRWTLPLFLIDDATMLSLAIAEGVRLQASLTAMADNRTPDSNPQTAWASAKLSLTPILKKYAKTTSEKIQTTIAHLVKDVADVKARPDFSTNNALRADEALLTKRIEHLQKKRYKTARRIGKARWSVRGERVNKYWFNLNKAKKPRDYRMANLAGSYHSDLQDAGRDAAHTPAENEANTQAVLDAIHPTQKLPPDAFPPLAAPVTPLEVERALSASKNGTATGLDGLPYELWKKLNDHHKKVRKLGSDDPSFDIVSILTTVFNDIQLHGLIPQSTLSHGWMCPIYKKNDKTEIANYRPITLLNTDYKLFTKVLASQLATAVPQMIHTDQAGFIPGRSIFDQTRLAKAMISYAEAMDENGAIVALDQEKAYDKIDHAYLWRALATFNLPEFFIRTVRSLYETAVTQVAVNGCFSAPYRVTRGVRQGDPLSCLLFDLAIEPFACMLRSSPKLSGYSVPGAPRRILVSLFADDTALYLSSTDRYDDVLAVLDSWCRASGAKFNINKTEIVPIGSLAHRNRMRTTRRIHPADLHVLDPGVNVADDGRPIRYLGLWMGNKVDDANTWSLILDKLVSVSSYN